MPDVIRDSQGWFHARWYGREAQEEVRRSVGLGLQAAAIWFASRVKEVLSAPAPRAYVTDPYTGERVLIATSPATPGAPPRKLSGHLRRSITWEMAPDGMKARVGTNVRYARQLELGGPISPRSKKSLRWLRAVPVPGKGKKPQYRGESVFASAVDQQAHPFLLPTLERLKGQIATIIGRGAAR